jgi:hypothetical protein
VTEQHFGGTRSLKDKSAGSEDFMNEMMDRLRRKAKKFESSHEGRLTEAEIGKREHQAAK